VVADIQLSAGTVIGAPAKCQRCGLSASAD
jgi:hypothetical protein